MKMKNCLVFIQFLTFTAIRPLKVFNGSGLFFILNKNNKLKTSSLSKNLNTLVTMYRTIFDSKTKQWTGLPKLALYNPNVSVGQVILEALDRNPDKIGQISDNDGRQMTNKEIRIKSIRAAKHFTEMGFSKNDVFGFIAKNSYHLAPIVFGSLVIGAAVNPLDPSYKKDEIIHMLEYTKPAAMFCDFDNITILREALRHLQVTIPVFTFGGKVDGARRVEDLLTPTEDEDYFVAPDIGDGTTTIAAILCSSGTTGFAKGVCLSHAALLYQLNLLKLNSNDIALTFSSLYWISGFGILLAATFVGAQRIITTDRFSPALMLEIIEKYRVTFTITAPSAISMLLSNPNIETTDLSSLTFFMSAGSVLHAELERRMNKFLTNCKVYSGYGMSEATGIVSVNYPSPKLDSVGKLAPGLCVKIIADDGSLCGISEDGEIILDMKYKFIGYYGDEDATASTLDENGYLHSGDIGHFDEDGYLYIVDRKKDILKYMNYQISPSEIENVILKHPGVKHVCVVGVPDAVCTDLPAAVVVRNLNNDVELNEIDIYDLVKSKLSDVKQLRGGVYFVDSVPMTPSGKLLRRLVRDIVVNLYNQKAVNFDEQ